MEMDFKEGRFKRVMWVEPVQKCVLRSYYCSTAVVVRN